MFSSIDELLFEEEEIDETIHPSRKDFRYLKRYTLAAGLSVMIFMVTVGANSFVSLNLLLAIPLSFVPLLLALESEIERRCVCYHFTDSRVVVERGVLNRNFYSIDYGEVTHLETEQALQERIFNVSDMHLHAAGEQNEEIILNGVEDAEKYRKLISKRS